MIDPAEPAQELLRCSKCDEADSHRLSIKYCGLPNQRCRQCCIKLLGSTARWNCTAHMIGIPAARRRQLEEGTVEPCADGDSEAQQEQYQSLLSQFHGGGPARTDARTPTVPVQQRSMEAQLQQPSSHSHSRLSSVRQSRASSRDRSRSRSKDRHSHSHERLGRSFDRRSDTHHRQNSRSHSYSYDRFRHSRSDRRSRSPSHGRSDGRSRSPNNSRSRSRSSSQSRLQPVSTASDQAIRRRATHGASFDTQEAMNTTFDNPVSRTPSTHARAPSSVEAATTQSVNYWRNLATGSIDNDSLSSTHSALLGPTLALERYKLQLQKELKPFASVREMRAALDGLLHKRAKSCTGPEAVALARVHEDILSIAATDLEFATEYLSNFSTITEERGGLHPEASNPKLPARDIQAFLLTQVKYPAPRPYFSRYNQISRESSATGSSPKRGKRGRGQAKDTRRQSSTDESTAKSGTKSCIHHPHSTTHNTSECKKKAPNTTAP
jgi:hypothetical protein